MKNKIYKYYIYQYSMAENDNQEIIKQEEPKIKRTYKTKKKFCENIALQQAQKRYYDKNRDKKLDSTKNFIRKMREENPELMKERQRKWAMTYQNKKRLEKQLLKQQQEESNNNEVESEEQDKDDYENKTDEDKHIVDGVINYVEDVKTNVKDSINNSNITIIVINQAGR